MHNPTIIRLQGEKRDREQFVGNLLSQAESEERALTDSEVANIEAAKERVAQIQSQLQPLVEWEEQRTSAADLDKRIRNAELRTDLVAKSDPVPLEGRSLGDAFVRSAEFRSAAGGVMRDRFFAPTTFGELTRAATVLNEGAAPGKNFLPAPQKIYETNPLLSYRLWDAVNHVQVNSNSVEHITWGTFEGGKSAAEVQPLGEKPSEELSSVLSTINIPVVAGLVEVTRQLLQDGGNAVRQWIDGELIRSIMYKAEKDIAGLLAGATATTGASKVPMMGVIRQAQAVIQSKGYMPNALIANPADLASLDQAIYTSGYLVPQVSSAYWGLTPIPSPTMAAGTVVVADLSRAITVFERTGIEVYTSDAGIVVTAGAANVGKDRFATNTFCLLAEARLKAAVTHADAMAKVVVTP
jgi:HK97 family phage major capsid protein